MLPTNQALGCLNFVISNWLFVILLSPLPHSPNYPESSWGNHPGSRRVDCCPGYWASNPESHPAGYSVSYWAGYSPENLVSNPEDCPDSNRASYSAGSSPNRWEDSSEGNPESNVADSPENRPEGSRESSLVDCLADCLGDARCRSVNRSDLTEPRLQFGAGAVLCCDRVN